MSAFTAWHYTQRLALAKAIGVAWKAMAAELDLTDKLMASLPAEPSNEQAAQALSKLIEANRPNSATLAALEKLGIPTNGSINLTFLRLGVRCFLTLFGFVVVRRRSPHARNTTQILSLARSLACTRSRRRRTNARRYVSARTAAAARSHAPRAVLRLLTFGAPQKRDSIEAKASAAAFNSGGQDLRLLKSDAGAAAAASAAASGGLGASSKQASRASKYCKPSAWRLWRA